MRMSNVVMIAVALVCALAAALFTRIWLVGQSARPPARTEAAAPAPSRSIVVAARDFKYGDRITAKTIKLVPWSGAKLPKGAFLSKNALFGAGQKQTALHTMAEGEPILKHKLVGGGSSGALSARIGSNMKAATIRVSEASGVSGLVQPDDRVDVFLTYSKQRASEKSIASAIVVLLQNIRVLALDQDTQRKDRPTSAKTVTLEVSTQDAQRLHLGTRIGELSLVLNSVGDSGNRDEIKPISTIDLIAAEKLTLPAAQPAPNPEAVAAPKAPEPAGPTVTVTRSTSRENYHVPDDQGSDDTAGHEYLRQHVGPVTPGQ